MGMMELFFIIPIGRIAPGIAALMLAFATASGLYRAYLIMAGFEAEPLLPLLKDFFIKLVLSVIAANAAYYTDGFVTPLRETIDNLATELSSVDGSHVTSVFGTIESRTTEALAALSVFGSGADAATLSNVEQATQSNGGEAVGFFRWAYNSMLDKFNTVADAVSSLPQVMDALLSILKILFVVIGLLWLGICALLVIVLNKIFFYLSLGVGPIFLLFLGFASTRNWFFSWLSVTAGYGFAHVAIMITFAAGSRVFADIFRATASVTWGDVATCLVACAFFSIILRKVGDVASSYFGTGNVSDHLTSMVGRSSMGASKLGTNIGKSAGKEIGNQVQRMLSKSSIGKG